MRVWMRVRCKELNLKWEQSVRSVVLGRRSNAHKTKRVAFDLLCAMLLCCCPLICVQGVRTFYLTCVSPTESSAPSIFVTWVVALPPSPLQTFGGVGVGRVDVEFRSTGAAAAAGERV